MVNNCTLINRQRGKQTYIRYKYSMDALISFYYVDNLLFYFVSDVLVKLKNC